MKVLVTGVAGQLGNDVMNELSKRGYVALGTDIVKSDNQISNIDNISYKIMDITNEEEVEKVISEFLPDAVVHCAAWTAVDLAEDEENKEKVYDINVRGTENIAKVCKKIDCKMAYISTDYVFNGQGSEPWGADCNDYEPLNVYGKSKLEGENKVRENVGKYYIVRIAWVFGANGNNFIKTMLKIGKRLDSLSIVSDQIGTPTYTLDLSVLLVDMIETDRYGNYNATNEGGYISWYDFAKEIFEQAVLIGHENYDNEHLVVKPVTTLEYGVSKAKRPYNSRLDKSKLVKNGFKLLPTWQDALVRYIKEISIENL